MEKAIHFAKNIFGISTLDKREDMQVAALALGAQYYGVKVRDMTNAYATFANNGVYREGRLYTKVYDTKGNLVLDNTQDSRVAVSEKTANYVNYCLKNAVEKGTGWGADFYTVDVAGKTGSTSSFRDRWFCGYTGYYTAAVWCGYDTPETIYLTNSSGNVAATLWKSVMQPVHAGLTNKPVSDTDKMVSVKICVDSGMVATDACASDPRGGRVQQVMLYPEDVPIATCKDHVMVDFCTACNCAANEYCLQLAKVDSTIVIEKKGLLKLTQSEIDELLRAEDAGLHAKHLIDNYVYVINQDGTDGIFYGFYGNRNHGILSPYLVCTIHTKEMWEAYVALNGGVTVPEVPGSTNNVPNGQGETDGLDFR